MIYTVTLNPSVDYIMFNDVLELGALNRANATYKFAGGKGINVSRVLKEFGVKSTALGFIGGFPGKFIEETLHQSNISTQFISVDEDTRINVKLKGKKETEINAPGPSVNELQQTALLDQITQLTQEDLLIISGSIPKSIDNTFYGQICKVAHQKNIPFVVDAENDLLLPILKYHPEFVKPNRSELEAIFNTTIEDDEDIKKYARELMKKGAKNVLVSLGGDGAILVTESIAYKAVVPAGQVINTVGAGDSTVAGMVYGMTQQMNQQERFIRAVSAGTATAFTEDLATFEQIEAIIPKIQIEII